MLQELRKDPGTNQKMSSPNWTGQRLFKKGEKSCVLIKGSGPVASTLELGKDRDGRFYGDLRRLFRKPRMDSELTQTDLVRSHELDNFSR